MLNQDDLIIKKDRYVALLNSLRTQDISAEVERRLASERARIEKEVTDEINQDIIKCEHYVELLNSLICEELEKAEEEKEEEEEEILQPEETVANSTDIEEV